MMESVFQLRLTFFQLKDMLYQRFLFGRLTNWLLSLIIAVAILGNILANDKPIYFKYKGHHFFPAFTDLHPFQQTNFYRIPADHTSAEEQIQLDVCDWKNLHYEQVIWCPIPYSPFKSDLANAGFISPFAMQYDASGHHLPLRFRHWLGTGSRGQDVLSGIIHGTSTTLRISLFAMLLAGIIGVFCGAVAGYFGNTGIRLHPLVLIAGCIFLAINYFYAFQTRYFSILAGFDVSVLKGFAQLIFSIFLFLLLNFLEWRMLLVVNEKFKGQKMNLPIDNLISGVIDLFSSLPPLIFIVAFGSIAKPGMLNLILLLGVFSWTGIARVCRAEFKRIKKLDYFVAAQVMGFSSLRIITGHMLKNSFSTIGVLMAFGLANCMLIESSLSFLGLGLSAEEVTWGSLISESRENFSAWWMVVFPGLAIVFCVYYFNRVADRMSNLRKKEIIKIN